jgi:hypothetical protein
MQEGPHKMSSASRQAASVERIECLTTLQGNDEIRNYWMSCRASRDADPDFTTFLVNTGPQAVRLKVLVVRDGNEPKALVVGRLERARLPVKMGYYRLPTPELRMLIIPYGGCLGEITEARATLIIDTLRQSLANGEADAVQLHWIDNSSILMREALARPMFICRDHFSTVESHRLLDLPADGRVFLDSLSSNERYQQRKRGRKLGEDFSEVRIRAICSPDEVVSLMHCAEEIACKSYQRGIGVGFAQNDEMRSRLEFHARAGWLRGFVLLLDGKPCAFWIGTLRLGIFTSDYLAFDPAYGRYAPGMYMILQVIDALVKDSHDPARQIDFGGGDSDYKKRLSNRTIEEASVFIFAPNFRALSANIMRSTFGQFNPIVKNMLNDNAWLAKAKKILRSRLSRGAARAK